MNVEAGTRLGPYEVLEPLGAGGMGEVWKARDVRLDRLVALKLLPAHLHADPEMQQRLEREARAVAGLSHPNVCVLHDVGEAGGRAYLVMELLEGESLADRIARGPIPFDQVLRIAIQMAAALDRAHRQGIVHRDLKPGNVMLTPAGAKLLDFGLARLGAPAVSGPLPGRSPVPVTQPPDGITREGMVVGTYQYMAPEQLEGKDADARSDIFALGALVYEMATGHKAFGGASQASVISAILAKDPPPMGALRPGVPSGLERLVRTCLAKDPEERWQSAHDVKRELEWIAETPASGDVATAALPRVGRRPRPAAGLLAAAGLGALAGAAALAAALGAFRRAPAPAGSVRFAIDLPPGESVGTLMRSALALSTDGRRLAWVGIRGGSRQLFVRALDAAEARALPGTDRCDAPFFSPDGEWIAYFGDAKLRKISLATEVAAVLCDAPEGRGGSWGEDGNILFSPFPGSGLFRVSAAGGKPERVTAPDAAAGENSHRWVDVLPGGRGVVYTVRTSRIESFDDALVAARALPGGRAATLVDGGTFARFVPPATLLYAKGAVLYAVPFDPAALRVTGAARKVVEGVSTNPTAGGVAYAVSRTGALAWLAGTTDVPKVSIRWVSPAGEEPPLAEFRRRLAAGALSPDKGTLVLRIAAANDDLWTYDLARGNLARLTSESGDEAAPVFTPDGSRVAFAANGGGGAQALFAIASDGSGRPAPLHAAAEDEVPACFTPDGGTLFVERPKGNGGGDIMVLTPGAEPQLRPFLAGPFRERSPAVAPDGKRVAWVSNESGRDEVYLAPWPGPGPRRVSTDGGERPIWTASGVLTYRSAARKRMSVRVEADGRVSPATALFDEPYLEVYGAAADGKRFLVLKNDEPLIPATRVEVWLGALAGR